MIYLKVKWNHNFDDEPTYIYSELDNDLNELRKVEIYKNNTIGYAFDDIEYNGTQLSIESLPTIEEISLDKQFEPSYISKEEFEKIWISIKNI